MRPVRLALLILVMTTAGCDPAALNGAFEPAPVMVTGLVVDAEDRPRPGSRVTFFSRPCEMNEAAPAPIQSEPAEVLTDAEGRFSAIVHVDSDRRGRPDACLLVRARLSSRIADPNYVLLPDSTEIMGRVNRSTLEMNVKVPSGGVPGEPRWEAMLTGGGNAVTITTSAHNDSGTPIRFLLRSPCTVMHRAHAGASLTEHPVWNEETVPGGCKSQRMEFHLDPGQTRVWTRTITADMVLRWPHPPGQEPLPSGVYTFESVVVQIAPRSDVLRLLAGTAHLDEPAATPGHDD
jgi:hypothetical protein